MYARVTQLEIDTLRTSVGEALARFQDLVLPALRQQPDYRGVYACSTPEGRAVLVSLWATEEAAAAMNDGGYYEKALSDFATMFRAPPGRGYYEVLLSDLAA